MRFFPVKRLATAMLGALFLASAVPSFASADNDHRRGGSHRGDRWHGGHDRWHGHGNRGHHFGHHKSHHKKHWKHHAHRHHRYGDWGRHGFVYAYPVARPAYWCGPCARGWHVRNDFHHHVHHHHHVPYADFPHVVVNVGFGWVFGH
jgi:hypothetical protein